MREKTEKEEQKLEDATEAERERERERDTPTRIKRQWRIGRLRRFGFFRHSLRLHFLTLLLTNGPSPTIVSPFIFLFIFLSIQFVFVNPTFPVFILFWFILAFS